MTHPLFTAARARVEALARAAEEGDVSIEIEAARIPSRPATLLQRLRAAHGEQGLRELIHVTLEESK